MVKQDFTNKPVSKIYEKNLTWENNFFFIFKPLCNFLLQTNWLFAWKSRKLHVFGHHSPPLTQSWCWFIQSKPTIPTLLWGGGGGLGKLSSNFIPQNQLAFCQVSQGHLASICNSYTLPGHFLTSITVLIVHTWYCIQKLLTCKYEKYK